VIIGAGVVGCSIAQQLCEAGLSVIVLEKNSRIADGVTSRNSGVIHAGLYYPRDSLKAESCIAGNRKIYQWCSTANVPHLRCGKWVIGGESQRGELEDCYEAAKLAGAKDISWGTDRQIQDLAKFGVSASFGFFSAASGIVDPYALAQSFRVSAEAMGGTFVCDTNVTGIERSSSGDFLLHTSRGPVESEILINAAGLYSDRIHQMLGFPEPEIYPYRGDYFRVSRRGAIPHLIYPVKQKNAAGLGIHLTIGLDGSCKLGPDVSFASSKEQFSIPENMEEKRKLFWEAGRVYLNDLNFEDLHYDTCGIRPKLRAFSEKAEKDFILREYLPGYIALLGIESPGLTAAIHLAGKVRGLLAL
jgi:L-2-hydroxyglutarate oxidase LhgO